MLPALIDLRRFVRSGDTTILVVNTDTAKAVFTRVGCHGATITTPPGVITETALARCALYRDGCRLAVTFAVAAVLHNHDVDHAELAMVSGAVLGQREPRHLPVGNGNATIIRRVNGATQFLAARLVDVSSNGVAFECDDRLVLGDELTVVRDDADRPLRIDVRVVHRDHRSGGQVVFGCRVVS